MKTNLYILFFLFLIPGCDLNVEILDEVRGDLLVNEKNYEANFAASAYAHLLHGFHWEGSIRRLNAIVSDEIVIPTRVEGHWGVGGVWRQLHKHLWTKTDGYITGSWQWADIGVSKVNTGLYYLDQMDSTEEREHFIAELRFLRAFFRYWQFDLFRQVPMRDEFDLQFEIPPKVITGLEAFDWLENELIDVIALLRDRDTTPYGRITKAAAQMLLAKLYLNAEAYTGNSKWIESLSRCNEIIGSGQYSINPNYFDIFGVNNHDNSEAIFVIRRVRTAREAEFPILDDFIQFWVASLHYSSPVGWGGWNGPVVVSDFLYTWDEDGDPDDGITSTDDRFFDDRIKSETGANLGFLMGPQFNADGSPIRDDKLSTPDKFVQLDFTVECALNGAQFNEGVRVIKYEPDFLSSAAGFQDNNDYMIFRYADLWLMAAEAKFRLGNVADALSDINTLRGFRNAPALISLTEQDILDERGFELYWEGWRRQDLIRFDQFTRPWANKEQSEKFREVFPIPALAISSNPNLEQNPGY